MVARSTKSGKARTRTSNRTRSGAPSALARRRHGNRKGKFPVFDNKSANSAIKLRGHGNRSAVLSKVSAYANRTGNEALKRKVKAAREADRKKTTKRRTAKTARPSRKR